MVSIVRESDVRVDLIRNVDNPFCKFSQRDFWYNDTIVLIFGVPNSPYHSGN
jgi:hypothetical protein